MNEEALTTLDIRLQYGVHNRTIYNWRRGWYQKGGRKIFILPDQSHLEYVWNASLRRIEYSPIKVAVWINKMRVFEENKVQKRILKIKLSKNVENKN